MEGVIDALDLEQDAQQQASEFQHQLLEALLRLWCADSSLEAVQLEVQSSLQGLIPCELVRVHLTSSFLEKSAFSGSLQPVENATQLIAVALADDAAAWAESDEGEGHHFDESHAQSRATAPGTYSGMTRLASLALVCGRSAAHHLPLPQRARRR